MDGRSGAVGTGGKRRAASRNRGLRRKRGRGLRGRTDGRAGTRKAGQMDGRADGQADGPNRAKTRDFGSFTFIVSLYVVQQVAVSGRQ